MLRASLGNRAFLNFSLQEKHSAVIIDMFIVDSKSSSTDVSRNGSEENFTRASNKEMTINHLIFAFLNRRHRSSILKNE